MCVCERASACLILYLYLVAVRSGEDLLEDSWQSLKLAVKKSCDMDIAKLFSEVCSYRNGRKIVFLCSGTAHFFLPTELGTFLLWHQCVTSVT